MPYIKKEDREEIAESVQSLFNKLGTRGEFNYAITLLIHKYILTKGLCYDTLNDVVGILSCAKSELYSSVIIPYEKKKKSENGAVSELDEEEK